MATRRRAATGRKYRCKGRTASGRIMKGFRLTKGGLVKVSAARKRRAPAKRRSSARRRGNGSAINMAGLFPDRRQLTLF